MKYTKKPYNLIGKEIRMSFICGLPMNSTPKSVYDALPLLVKFHRYPLFVHHLIPLYINQAKK